MDTTIHVALLAEGVDRNGPWDGKYIVKQASPSSRRAWIEIAQKCCFWRFLRSPSSRRAWIEICKGDKNVIFSKSPSSRRAWIEIGLF